MRSQSIALSALIAVSCLALTACTPTATDKPAGGGSSPSITTRGPNGEEATPSSDITLSDSEKERLRAGSYTAALLWPASGDFIDAVNRGATDEFGDLGVKVVATTDAQFDPAKQQNDIATATALRPSAVLSLPVDPSSGAVAYQPLLDAGSKIVFMSNVPVGWTQGDKYVSVATDDLAAMGSLAADALAEAIGGSGKIGYIYHDAEFYVTNQRDQAFKSTIESKYPSIELVAEAGLTDPSSAEETANAMLLRNPDLDGIYVTWSQPAEGVLSALRSAGNTKTKLVTLDLSEPIALDLVSGGNVAGIVADEAYTLGRTLAKLAAYGLLQKEAPPFVIVPAVPISANNLQEAWMKSLNVEAPAALRE
ncbi:substrate-binding domain-containing protein [Luethyella okanaganae]|uniref:Substrate-binding domain-containing protein n=1 Tax=Luethyella okanaganae TaxID=69372 RepID=A0ABW1VER4_9MICO